MKYLVLFLLLSANFPINADDASFEASTTQGTSDSTAAAWADLAKPSFSEEEQKSALKDDKHFYEGATATGLAIGGAIKGSSPVPGD